MNNNQAVTEKYLDKTLDKAFVKFEKRVQKDRDLALVKQEKRIFKAIVDFFQDSVMPVLERMERKMDNTNDIVNNHERRLERHDDQLFDHDKRLGVLEQALMAA